MPKDAGRTQTASKEKIHKARSSRAEGDSKARKPKVRDSPMGRRLAELRKKKLADE